MTQKVAQESLKEYLEDIEIFKKAEMVWGNLYVRNDMVQKCTMRKGEGAFAPRFALNSLGTLTTLNAMHITRSSLGFIYFVMYYI